MFLKPGAQNANEIELVAPTGFEPVSESRRETQDRNQIDAERANARRRHHHAIVTRSAAANTNGAERCIASASAPMTTGPRMWPTSVIVRSQPTAKPASGGSTRSPM